jgi:choline-sulfatase
MRALKTTWWPGAIGSLAAIASLAACDRLRAAPGGSKPGADAALAPKHDDDDAAPPGLAASAAAATSAAGAASAAGSAAPGAARRPLNVLVVSIDSLRADMPWSGYPRGIAPRLTEFAKKATVYGNAYSISSFTSKSLGGFLGGRLPSELERTAPFFTRYLPQNKMFPEALQEQGVHTLTAHAHAYLAKNTGGFEQGFDDYRLVPGITFDYNRDPYVTSQKLTPLAIEMLSDAKLTTGRFFAWFHFMDPHDTYQSHEEGPHWGKKPRDLYDEEVFYTDLWVGKFFDWVEKQPWAAETAIVVTADHGEAFGEHGLTRHAFELYEPLVHVPLMIYVPGRPGRRIEAARSHVDLVPTMFDLLGAKPNPELRGKTFVGELYGGEAEERDVICDLPEDSYNERRRSLLHDHWKIIAFANDVRYELYNLADDPAEKTNLIKKDAEKAREMIERYKEANKTVVEAPVKGGVKKHKEEK